MKLQDILIELLNSTERKSSRKRDELIAAVKRKSKEGDRDAELRAASSTIMLLPDDGEDSEDGDY